MDESLDDANAGVLRERLAASILRALTGDELAERTLPHVRRRRSGRIDGEAKRCSGLLASRAVAPQSPEGMKTLELLFDKFEADLRHERGEDLEDDRPEVRQSRDDLLADPVERIRDRARVRVEPEAVELHAAREMNLPYSLQRQLLEVVAHRLATVERVREDVVEVEQETTVRRLDDLRHELAVWEFVQTRTQVVDPGLDCDRGGQSVLQIAYGRRNRLDTRDGLSRRQEEPRGELGRLVEAQMIARPRRL